MEKKGICPRCKAESADLGPTVLPLGRTRGMKTTTYSCPKCGLVFFEKSSEE
ncbi:MAG: hypothetical protein WED05_12880 [Candidatus Atabeyarchaeum deiterrae]